MPAPLCHHRKCLEAMAVSKGSTPDGPRLLNGRHWWIVVDFAATHFWGCPSLSPLNGSQADMDVGTLRFERWQCVRPPLCQVPGCKSRTGAKEGVVWGSRRTWRRSSDSPSLSQRPDRTQEVRQSLPLMVPEGVLRSASPPGIIESTGGRKVPQGDFSGREIPYFKVERNFHRIFSV